ncbi:MAG: thiopeptide-type bacteriocin biosynthesis protein [Gemmatimonadaceae bacterium]
MKLYTGPAIADRLITDVIAPQAEQLVAEGAALRWFFLRYADPQFHIRLRLQCRPDTSAWEALRRLSEACEKSCCTSRIQVDTYNREIERYGGAVGIALAEQVFCADSRLVVDLMRSNRSGILVFPPELIAAASVNRLLEAMGLAAGERASLFSQQAYWKERTRASAANSFRAVRFDLRALLGPGATAIDDVMSESIGQLRSLLGEVRARSLAGDLTVSLSDFAMSITHMHVNRLIRYPASRAEHRIYDYIARHWRAELARQGAGASA